MDGMFVTVSMKCVWNTTAKAGIMPPFIFPCFSS